MHHSARHFTWETLYSLPRRNTHGKTTSICRLNLKKPRILAGTPGSFIFRVDSSATSTGNRGQTECKCRDCRRFWDNCGGLVDDSDTREVKPRRVVRSC